MNNKPSKKDMEVIEDNSFSYDGYQVVRGFYQFSK